MASPASTPVRSKQGSDFIDSMTYLVPPGHEKPLKQAVYTAAAMLIVAVGCAAAAYVYFMLEIFIKPLLWALLCGSFLFPFKYSLTMILESWLKTQEENGKPLIVGAMLIPLSVFDGFAEKLGRFVMNRWKIVAAITGMLAVLQILYLVQLLSVLYFVVMAFFQSIVFLWNSTSIILEICAHYRVIIMTLVGAYFIVALVLEPGSVPLLEYAATPAWIFLLVCMVSVAGSMKVPFGIALAILSVTGVVSAKNNERKRFTRSLLERTSSITAMLSPSDGEPNQTMEEISEGSVSDDEGKSSTVSDGEVKYGETFYESSETPSEESTTARRSVSDIQPVNPPASAGSISGLRRRRMTRDHVMKGIHRQFNNDSSSAVFFHLLFAAFTLVMIWMHAWLVFLLLFTILYWGLKHLLYHEKVEKFAQSQCEAWLGCDLATMKQNASAYLKTRKNVLVPSSVRGIIELVLKGDKKFNSALLGILPTMTSIIMILILIFGSLFMTVFFAVKIQEESFLMVQITSDLINETVSNHPEYQAWLPDNETMQKSMDSLVDSVYLQGREWIKDQVQSNIGKDANVSLVEKQALKIWDRAYQSWFNKSVQSSKSDVNERKLLRRQTSDLAQDGSSGLFSGIMDLLNMTEVVSLLKENMSALMSVMESIWSLLQSNASLVFSSITTVLTIFLNGGTAILNFLLSTIIFFTTLFYLLAGSKKQYIPVHWIGGSSTSSNPGPIATAIQDAISGVFGASLKMASFYGLYTWLNHTTFGAILVYVPSMLAAIFSVIPIFTTYWVCFPAFFEIWLLQGDLLRGLMLVFFQFLPTMFFDAMIYTEMTESGGGHPYVTGLAVAGGLYYFGLEGAIIGPILLCILLVGLNIYTRVMGLPVNSIQQGERRKIGSSVFKSKTPETELKSDLPEIHEH